MSIFEIQVTDLAPCSVCGCHQPLIFEDTKSEKWFISCGKKIKCGNETAKHKELAGAAKEWGLEKKD